MNCDHENLRTKFCPHCGRAADFYGIDGLLAHVRSGVADAFKDLLRARNRGNADRIAEKTKSAAQWNSWLDELARLITEASAAHAQRQ